MRLSVGPGTTCYAVPRLEWNEGKLDSVVLHKVTTTLVFEPGHVAFDPQHPELAGPWKPYADAGWYGFFRGGAWVLLVRQDAVQAG